MLFQKIIVYKNPPRGGGGGGSIASSMCNMERSVRKLLECMFKYMDGSPI